MKKDLRPSRPEGESSRNRPDVAVVEEETITAEDVGVTVGHIFVMSEFEKDLVKPVRLLVFEQKYVVAMVAVILSSIGLLLALAVKDTIHACISLIFHRGELDMCEEGLMEQMVIIFIVFLLMVLISSIFRLLASEAKTGKNVTLADTL